MDDGEAPQKKNTKITCPECGAQYNPNGGGHCRGGPYGGCCRTFTSDSSAALHRVGPYEPRGLRRCLTVEEMLAAGWRDTGARGWTKHPPMPSSLTAQWKSHDPSAP